MTTAAPQRRHYITVFLLSMALLQLEIAVARIMSVALFSHYAFVAVSLAMCGLGISGLVVYLLPQHYTRERLEQQLVSYAWRFSIASLIGLLVFLRLHVVQELSWTGFLTLSAAYLVLAVQFFLGGVCLSLLMTHFSGHIGRIYGADLLGASVGCIGAVVALSLASAPTVVVFVAAIVAVTAVGLAWTASPRRLTGPVATLTIVVAALIIGPQTNLLRMRYVKTWTHFYSEYEAWNAFSRVATFPSAMNSAQLVPLKEPHARYAGAFFPPAMNLDIDGTAWTPMVKFDGDYERFGFLRNTVMYVAHHLRAGANVLIIGTGGGRDILAAKVFEQPRVVGIEINPLMRHFVQERYGDYSGRPYTLPGVSVIIDEARSRLSTLDERFKVLQLSLIDTFSLNAAGGFVFSENYLYTVDAFREYFRHLTDDGILSVSRYCSPNYTLEILRVAAMMRAAWNDEGVAEPMAHVVALRQRETATILAKRTPFTTAEIERLAEIATAQGMAVLFRPDQPNAGDADLGQILTTPNFTGYLAGHRFRINPPTDDQPFFFNFLRGRLAEDDIPDEREDPFQFIRKWHDAVTLLYMLIAIITGLALTVFFVPLLVLQRRPAHVPTRIAVPLLGYFACLGYGFMMLEVPLLQHFVLFLGYPVYALAVVLFSLLLFSGIGSLLTSQFPNPSAALSRLLLAIVALAVVYAFVVPAVIAALLGTSIAVRIATTVVLLAPFGLLLGMAYPLGIAVLRGVSEELVPWAWGLNGALSVVATVLAVFIGSRAGFTVAFATGVTAYALAYVAMRMAEAARSRS
jgi:spermidine synthase